MVSRSRSFLAAILLTAAAGFAAAQQAQQAQQAGAPPPPLAPAAVRHEASTTVIVGEWMLAGVLIVALFGIITRTRRHQIVDFTRLAPKLKPVPATRTYGPRPV